MQVNQKRLRAEVGQKSNIPDELLTPNRDEERHKV
jgi:hypothetical protein